ncbi:hypothetical protein [Nocardiopsis coralliicola]
MADAVRRNVARSPQALADDRLRDLLARHRGRLERRDTLLSGVDLAGTAAPWAALPAGPEPLFSADRPGGAAASAPISTAAALREGSGPLRYGYPLVVLDCGGAPFAAPLFAADAELLPGSGGAAPRVRLTGPPDVHPGLLRLLGADTAEERAALRAWLREGPEDGPSTPAARTAPAVAALAQKAHALLARLQIPRADTVAPAALRGAPPLPPGEGAYNVALVYRPAPAASAPPELGTSAPLCADLDPGAGGIDPGKAAGTALAPVLTCTDRERDEAVLPVAAARLTQERAAAVQSALRRTLTTVHAAAGASAAEAVDAAVRTARTAGLSVVVAAPASALPASWGDPEAPLDSLVLRADAPDARAAEECALRRVLDAPAEPPDHVALRHSARDDWVRVQQAWRAMDAVAAEGHALVRLGAERRRLAACGWDPQALFGQRRGDPESWLARFRRAAESRLGGRAVRAAVRRELGIAPTSDHLDALARAATVEAQWRRSLDRRHRATSVGDLAADLAAALACQALSGAELAAGEAERRAARGRAAARQRAGALEAPGSDPWYGFARSLSVLPAWAVAADAASSLPAVAGLFDLVVVAEADRVTAAELLPLLYRARHALVLGDPAQPHLDAFAAHGPAGARGAESAADGGSALEVCTTVAEAAGNPDGRVLRLTEAERTSCALVAATAQALPSRTLHPVPGPPPPSGLLDGPPVAWVQTAGSCTPEPGASAVNRDEAYRTAVAVDRLDADLPAGIAIAVTAPWQGQVALLRRLIRPAERQRVAVLTAAELRARPAPGSTADPAAALGRAAEPSAPPGAGAAVADVVVVSATGGPGGPPPDAAAERMWAAAVGRARQRVVIVGDRSYWERRPGAVRALLSASRTGTGAETGASARISVTDPQAEQPDPEAGRAGALLRVLDEGGLTSVAPCPAHADARVRTAQGGEALAVLDDSRDGAGLYRVLSRARALESAERRPVVCVPAWRCADNPAAVVRDIAAAADRA